MVPLRWMFNLPALRVRWLGIGLALWCVLTATLAAPAASLQLSADELFALAKRALEPRESLIALAALAMLVSRGTRWRTRRAAARENHA